MYIKFGNLRVYGCPSGAIGRIEKEIIRIFRLSCARGCYLVHCDCARNCMKANGVLKCQVMARLAYFEEDSTTLR